ncbi:MAG: hypothetical protein HY747_09705 [Elusimicrobia bacterium]|nr:hypothetical protein [Elusimicrobiota bacterium]
MPVTIEEYKEMLVAKLVEEAPTLDKFRSNWIVPPKRRELLAELPDAGRSALIIQQLEEMQDYDLYDVLAELGYGLAPRTRAGRADAFTYKHKTWLSRLPDTSRMTLLALVAQFSKTGTDGLENPQIFQTPDVLRAGGLTALKAMGKPAEIFMDAKQRIFAA